MSLPESSRGGRRKLIYHVACLQTIQHSKHGFIPLPPHSRHPRPAHCAPQPENVLIGGDGYLKVGDFGFAKAVGSRGVTRSFCGTPDYLAPEVVFQKVGRAWAGAGQGQSQSQSQGQGQGNTKSWV